MNTRLGLTTDIVDRAVYRQTVSRFREAGIALPTFAQLAAPDTIPLDIRRRLGAISADAPHPLNLFRVHWFNSFNSFNGGRASTLADHPAFLELPTSLTGVAATIVVALGRYFPLIRAHKVMAAYGCLAPRLITGQFDPTRHRAIWPSTGNYCRGGVAISRIMGCRGIAVLPEGMSRERFAWLERWVSDPADIVRTPGCESNVKEIYDACAALARDEQNVIFNQFCEFGNYLVHRRCTGPALAAVVRALLRRRPRLRARAFVSATGSAGTIAAGDHLKRALPDLCDAREFELVAVEAVECPTLLRNGYGEHNIQGIGDKHVPLIHNVKNTDYVIGVSDRACDGLDLLFNSPAGRAYLRDRRHVPEDIVASLDALGLSGIANVLAAIKLARARGFGPDDVILTVATDDASMYGSSREALLARAYGGRSSDALDAVDAAELAGEHLLGVACDHVQQLGHEGRERVFNLGYYTWVEQQGVSLADFDARRRPAFWDELVELIPRWDRMIEAFNHETGVLTATGRAR